VAVLPCEVPPPQPTLISPGGSRAVVFAMYEVAHGGVSVRSDCGPRGVVGAHTLTVTVDADGSLAILRAYARGGVVS